MIVLAYDHRSYELMTAVKKYFEKNNLKYVEFASPVYDKMDSYSLYTKQANKYILENPKSRGIYSCRSGIGVSIMANRFKGIRAGVCYNTSLAFLGRNDDDINVLVLPAETVSEQDAIEIIDIFLNTPFEGGRHIERLNLLDK